MKVYPNSHAGKGKDFEVEINAMCDIVNMAGGFAHKLQPEKVGVGQALKVIRGEPFDYIIIVPDEIHCFDAKVTQSDAWPITGILDGDKGYAIHRQASNMLRVSKLLGKTAQCYFAVWFKAISPSPTQYPLVRFEADAVIEAARRGVKALRPSDGVAWHFMDILEKCPDIDYVRRAPQWDKHIRRWVWVNLTFDMFPKHHVNPDGTIDSWEEA
ncbi:MAG: hypothetical protein IJP89_02480 [Synergistaceae bacterium]|nr:hypothetical protein [Synergistaceae bacterium]